MYGKLGTDQFAQATANAGGSVDHRRWVVAFRIELFGFYQYPFRAELDAESTTLTAFPENVNDTVWDSNVFQVKGFAPIFHNNASQNSLVGLDSRFDSSF